MSTVAGQISSQMLVYKLKVLTLHGIMEVSALEATWADTRDEPQLEESLARECTISRPSYEGSDTESFPRLILGCKEVTKFPRRVSTPGRLTAEHPKMAVFQSLLTGNLLACGPLGQD